MIRTHEIDLFDVSTLNFEKCYDTIMITIMIMIEIVLTLQQLNSTSNVKSNYFAFVDRFQNASLEMSIVFHQIAFASSIISSLTKTKIVLDFFVIDALTKFFEKFRVNAIHFVQFDTLRHLIRQELIERFYSIVVQKSSIVSTSTQSQSQFQFLSQVQVHTQQIFIDAQLYFQFYFSYDKSIIESNQCLVCKKKDHRKRDCSHLNVLIIEEKIYLNERFKLCYERVDQKSFEMRLSSSMSQVDDVRLCLREQKTQHAMQMKTIRIEKTKSSNENDTSNESKNMIVKIRVARQEVDSKTRKTS